MDTSKTTTFITPAPGVVLSENLNKTADAPTLRKVDNERSKKFRMVALDLDGTLLQSNHVMSRASAEYLQSLHKRGILVILASGRAPQTMYEHVLRLGPLFYPQFNGMPIVCSNGAKGLVCRAAEDGDHSEVKLVVDELFFTPVPLDAARSVVELANRLGLVTQFYWNEEIYANPSNQDHFKLTEGYMKLTGATTIYVKDGFRSILSKNGLPSKLLVMCNKSDQDSAMDAFEKALGSEATIVRGSYGWFLEILHKDVCKGHGLRVICDKLKVPIEQCVAFGDGDNDIEFLQMAGRGIAMKNARACVKEVADHVTQHSNNEDGVIRALQQMEKDGFLDLKQ